MSIFVKMCNEQRCLKDKMLEIKTGLAELYKLPYLVWINIENNKIEIKGEK